MPTQNRFSFSEAKQIGEASGIDWNASDVEQFQSGLEE